MSTTTIVQAVGRHPAGDLDAELDEAFAAARTNGLGRSCATDPETCQSSSNLLCCIC